MHLCLFELLWGVIDLLSNKGVLVIRPDHHHYSYAEDVSGLLSSGKSQAVV